MTTKQEVNNNRDEAFKALAGNIIPVNAFAILMTALAYVNIEWRRISHLPKNHIEEEMREYSVFLEDIKNTADDSSRFKKELCLTNVTTDQMYDYDKVMRNHLVDRTHYMIVPDNLKYLNGRNKCFSLLAMELSHDDEDISELGLAILYEEVAIDAMTMIKLSHPT